MTNPKRISAVVIARQMRQYSMGDKVKILRGKMAGQIVTIHQSANDWVTLEELMKRDPSRWVMSKGNVEPIEGFTDEEINQARRAADRMQGHGSLI